jgi:hypothetical protein
MLFHAPFKLGPFSVDAMGLISPEMDRMPTGFTFRWHGRAMYARLRVGDEGRMTVSLSAQLGWVPSTALGKDASIRYRTLAVVRALPRSLPNGWRVCLLPDHQCRLEVQTEMEMPTTATALLSELTGVLLRLEPYLQVLNDAGVLPGRC